MRGRIQATAVLLLARAAIADEDGNESDKRLTGADLVEVLEDAPDATPPPRPQPVQEKLEFRGFARLTAGIGLAPSGPAPKDAVPPERVAYDRFFDEQHLYLDLRYVYGRVFQAVASASLSFEAYRVENRPGTPAPQPDRFEYRLPEAVPRETYVGLFFGRLDLRLGQQRIAWGVSDAFTPNDVLNARDRRNPFMFDPEMINLPTPAVRADLDLGLAVASLVVQPFLIPDRFDFYGTNWALVQPSSPRFYRRFYGFLSADRDRNLFAELQDLQTRSQLPEGLSGTSVGGSLKLRAGSVDTSFYYHYGYDRSPAIYMDPAFTNQLLQVDPSQIDGVILDGLLKALRASTARTGGPLILSYVRRHHVGVDAQTAIGPVVLRLDAAYDSAVTYYDADTLVAAVRPTAQAVAGFEYQTGDANKLVAIEASYVRLLDPAVSFTPLLTPPGGGTLLFFDRNTVAFGGLLRWMFFEHLVFELRATAGVQPYSYVVRPEIGYASSSFTARLGGLAVGGSGNGYGSLYDRNDTLYTTVRYSF